MIKVDSHVHTRNSHDGKLPISDIVARAKSLGVSYICTTDHVDYDIFYGGCKAPVKWGSIDMDAYYNEWKAAKSALYDDKNNALTLGFGIEASFCDSAVVSKKYLELMDRYSFDAVINSVHCVKGKDAYFRNYFFFKPKHIAYGDYLDEVLKSLDAPYRYEIVAHIGYLRHGAPYRDKDLRYSDFPKKIDAILHGVIERGKTLEVNCHHDIVPYRDILERYYELGGRKISYGGDSHRGELCNRFEEVSKLLSEIGFTHYSVFLNRKELLVPIGDALSLPAPDLFPPKI